MKSSYPQFGLCVVLAALQLGCSSCPHPSDADLRSRFLSHKVVFEELTQMATNDGCVVRIDFDWTSPDEATLARCGVTTNRLQEYRRLLKEVGASGGLFRRKNRGEIGFIISTYGVMVTGSGSSKSIVFRTEPTNAKTGESACTCESNGVGDMVSYRLIEGNWYVAFEC